MKAYIGPYTNYISPYDIAKRIFFWKDPYDDEEGKAIDALGNWLRGKKGDKPSLTSRFCNWYNQRQKRTVAITIDGYDTWSADHTLALIIHPLLLKIKENKKGSPFVDPEDVPEDLRPKTEPNDSNHYVDDTHHERWDWVLDQMIFPSFRSWLLKDGKMSSIPVSMTSVLKRMKMARLSWFMDRTIPLR